MTSAAEICSKMIQPRALRSHKGDYGRVLLIGGLYPYGGAIVMSALAAVHSGAGLVTVATDKEIAPSLHSRLPEAMVIAITDETLLTAALQEARVILIGPGLGESIEAKAILDKVLEMRQDYQHLIIDGSALNLLAQKELSRLRALPLILTPHQKEWERLSHIPINQQTPYNTQGFLSQFPKGTILVAKSAETKVYQENVCLPIGVGGPYQATGGMGDTLCGMIAGFLGQFNENPFEIVVAATYLHSYIAEVLSKESYVVLPTEISRHIPYFMKHFEKKL